MNSVSLFLYAADVLTSLGGLLVFITVSCGMFVLACVFGSGVIGSDFTDECPNAWKYGRRCIIWGIICALVATIIPSKNTMYAIAASQVGEQVVKSEAVQGLASDATKALQSWIKSQITPPEAKK